jgi:glycosyltransferase involved in cell wall biosynthesis
LERNPAALKQERFGNVTLHRLQSRTGKAEKSSLGYLLPILRFMTLAAVHAARSHRRKPYDFFHVHNIPDFLVFAAWLPRLTGARVVLDIHDIVPEFFASKFGVKEESLVIKLLKLSERASAAVSDHVIIANHLWRDKYAARVGARHKCSVFINNVDGKIFHPRERTRRDGKLIVMFPGGLQWHQGLDIGIRAFQHVSARLPHAEFHIYGDGNMKHSLVELTKELGLEKRVLFFEPLPVRKIAEIMANADLGVVPKRADSFGNEAYSTKIMEFMSLGVPVVASSTSIDRFYFDATVLRFFPSGDVEALASAMIDLLTNADTRERLRGNALAYAGRNNWDTRKHDYLALVDDLIEHGRHTPIADLAPAVGATSTVESLATCERDLLAR